MLAIVGGITFAIVMPKNKKRTTSTERITTTENITTEEKNPLEDLIVLDHGKVTDYIFIRTDNGIKWTVRIDTGKDFEGDSIVLAPKNDYRNLIIDTIEHGVSFYQMYLTFEAYNYVLEIAK